MLHRVHVKSTLSGKPCIEGNATIPGSLYFTYLVIVEVSEHSSHSSSTGGGSALVTFGGGSANVLFGCIVNFGGGSANVLFGCVVYSIA